MGGFASLGNPPDQGGGEGQDGAAAPLGSRVVIKSHFEFNRGVKLFLSVGVLCFQISCGRQCDPAQGLLLPTRQRS